MDTSVSERVLARLEPLPPGIRLLTDEEAGRLRLRHPGLPRTPDDCPTCRGRKVFRWWAYDDEGAASAAEYECPCLDQWVLHRYLLNANIGLTYQRLGWRDVRAEQGAVDKVAAYLDHADDYLNAGCGLILWGNKGAGKTMLAALVLKALLARGYSGYFTTFSEMLDLFTAGWHDRDEKALFYRRVKNAGVLVLDDVGREFKQRRMVAGQGMQDYTTATAEAAFDEVLRHRVANSKPTILTTNLDMRQLEEGYGGNTMSLLHERSTTYHFTGGDFRDQARMRLDEEIVQGLTRPVVLA